MSKTIVIANQKGGVGKSTTVVNLGTALAINGKKVLVVDFDPQANAVSGFGVDKEKLENTVYDLLLDDDIDISTIIVPTEIENLMLLPANIDLSGATVELADVDNKYYILKNKLTKVHDQFDYILIDTPPSLGLLTLSGLCAADEILIPLQAEYYALEGISQLIKTINLVQKKLNPSLKLMGIFITMYDGRTNLSEQVLAEVKNAFKDNVFKSIIPRSVKLSEAPSFGKPIFLYQPASVGAIAYNELAKEIINHG